MNPSSTSPAAPIPVDALATVASPQTQKLAARLAQDAFSQIFRATVGEDDAGRGRAVAALQSQLLEWADAADHDDARSLRLALLMTGLDQWGVAYSKAFALQAIPGLTELLGGLRTSLEARDDARLQRQYAAIEAAEANAIDFKIDLRRSIHLALWYAMISGDDRDQATAVLVQLGGMLFALVRQMPELGWRLVADTLAHIQIRCLAEGLAAEGLARETTESLFGALSQELPSDRRDLIMAHAAQTVIAWQQANRSGSGQVH